MKPGPEQHHTDPLQSALDGTDPNADFEAFFAERAADLAAIPDAEVGPNERTRRNGLAFAKAFADSFTPDPDTDEAA